MDVLQGLTMSLLVLLALAGTVFYLRNRGMARFELGKRAPRRLQAVERLSLTPQHALHLVQVDGRLMLIASAPGGCNIIGPLETFSEALNSAGGKQ